MSLATNLRKASELAAIVKPAGVTPSCNCYPWGITFMVDPWELVRVFNLLNVRKSAIQTTAGEKYYHIRFNARGAEWVAVIDFPELESFYAKLGASVGPLLTAKAQPRIEVKRPQPLLIPPAIGGGS
jgi:hypothetical protein